MTIATVKKQDFVGAHIAAKILIVSVRHVRRMCERGVFSTAFKPGYGQHAHWRILRAEVQAHRFNGHATYSKERFAK